ncbi:MULTISPECIES: FAD:protein FMN transferase [Dyella]|uniref:FAD:protein FMN transferase n=2 Tax=Dyella TaxID=231454 RepID=A0A4R0YYC8_9GAMM|nr:MULTISPECIES: FAD:protein FMN transferase [Dyella]TBR40029.1 FAD:protein FMN transferase [Dyella terrae]TCI12389.1 FAD:protein FMN transferase [Dyella soli]
MSLTVESLSGDTMGTTWSARVVVPAGVSLDDLQAGVQAQLDRVDAQMSTYKADSDLSRFNQAPAQTWVALPGECFAVVQYALRVAELTQGAYDPTVGPLVNAWGFGPDGVRADAPPDSVWMAARSRVGWQRVLLRESTCEAWQAGGTYLDLSSVAKGFSVDVAGAWLTAQGIEAWLMEVGGEMKGHGRKPDGMPWRVGIEWPDGSGQHSQIVPLEGRAIATSGNYRRHFAQGQQHFAHHIDPRSGMPSQNRVASVSVLANSAMEADPWGTAMTVLGPDRGLSLARELRLAVLIYVQVADDFDERMSSAFAEALRAG